MPAVFRTHSIPRQDDVDAGDEQGMLGLALLLWV